MTKRSSSPAKPHAKKKAAREKSILEPVAVDAEWAQKIGDALLAGCHPFQRDVVTDPARRYSMLVGRGGAKTTSFRVRAIRKMTSKSGAKILYFAKTGKRAKDLMWKPLKGLLHRLGFVVGKDVTYNETELCCTIIRTGSTIQLSGLEDTADADKWRGDTFDEVMFDECGALKPELVEYTVFEVIGPRVHVIGLAGTPGRDRRKLFYEATRPGSDKHRPYRDRAKYPDFNGYSSHSWDLEDIIALPNAKKLYAELCRLWAEALIEKRDNKWSDDNPIWLREYKKTWAADNTLRVFGSFEPHRDGKPWNVWDPFDGKGLIEGVAGLRIAIAKLKKLHPEFTDWRFVVPKDQGHKDPFACNPLAFSPHDPQRRKWQVMSFERMGMGYGKPIAQLLMGEAEVDAFVKTDVFPTKFGGVFGELGGWPDGMIIDSDNALLEDLKNVYGIKTEKADKKPDYKKGAIELVNGEFTDGRLIVLLGSPMQEQLEQLQWKEQDNGTLIEDPAQANHSTDTAVYGCQLIATMFSSGLVAQDSKTQQPQNYQDPMGLEPGIGTIEQPDDEQALLAPSEWSEDDEDW
jgi:hypothetical protein